MSACEEKSFQRLRGRAMHRQGGSAPWVGGRAHAAYAGARSGQAHGTDAHKQRRSAGWGRERRTASACLRRGAHTRRSRCASRGTRWTPAARQSAQSIGMASWLHVQSTAVVARGAGEGEYGRRNGGVGGHARVRRRAHACARTYVQAERRRRAPCSAVRMSANRWLKAATECAEWKAVGLSIPHTSVV